MAETKDTKKPAGDAARDKAREAELARQKEIEDAVAEQNAKDAPAPGESRSISWLEPGLGR